MAKTPDRAEAPAARPIAANRKAFHQYEVLQKLECGLVLTGTEVKSLREGSVSFVDSFATVKDGELLLLGLHIAEYRMGNRFNHPPARTRKLLAKKSEIRRLKSAIEQRGLTLVPLGMHWRRGLAKVELGIVRGKKLHDKRDAIREREGQRERQRAVREFTKGGR